MIHFDEAIYPILVQTEKLETYREKTKYYVYYYCPVLSSLEKNVYTIDGWSYESMYPNVKWGDTLADILPLPEILEGYTFVGYSNIPIRRSRGDEVG